MAEQQRGRGDVKTSTNKEEYVWKRGNMIATYHTVYSRGAIIASCARSDANNNNNDPYGKVLKVLLRIGSGVCCSSKFQWKPCS